MSFSAPAGIRAEIRTRVGKGIVSMNPKGFRNPIGLDSDPCEA
jgi:hypothetical protein